ncbi:Subunit of Outer Membrane Protein Assembly Complex: SmpA [Serratia symbiotica str. 'Cinara cedri']|nr:Subunit of Outer Membrane Protein Assembly Complex: SmpA [Serratia symbiotica str. 'Cinara cedri']
MLCKILSAFTIAFIILTTGCSFFEKIVYRPDISQGNYLTSPDVVKIKKGMTQQQVVDILGTPMLQDPFGAQIWFYIFREEKSGYGRINQYTLTLVFNSIGILKDIQYKSTLSKYLIE